VGVPLGKFYHLTWCIRRKRNGTVTRRKKSGAEVNATVSSGSNWKWPKQEDKLFYYLRDTVMVISDPVPIGKRGIFRVVEMDKFV